MAETGNNTMKLASYIHKEKRQYGAFMNDRVYRLGEDIMEVLRGKTRLAPDMTLGPSASLSEVRLLPPVPAPEKIICIGLNYRDHARESNMEIPQYPVFFAKYRNALAGPFDNVVLPGVSTKVDYEAELAVVIGKGGRHIDAEDALDHVAGYMALNDVSARDFQFRSSQWLQGKTFDTFAPCGPFLVTRDEVPHPNALDIRLALNGQVMQQSNTREFIFDVEQLIAYISQIMTLSPGDIISTGTPPGVGFARKPPMFLKPGDVMEVEVEKVGLIRNKVVAEEASASV